MEDKTKVQQSEDRYQKNIRQPFDPKHETLKNKKKLNKNNNKPVEYSKSN